MFAWPTPVPSHFSGSVCESVSMCLRICVRGEAVETVRHGPVTCHLTRVEITTLHGHQMERDLLTAVSGGTISALPFGVVDAAACIPRESACTVCCFGKVLDAAGF